jgi:uncharacterized membrane protein YdjX (TVP38/TMEM64 family)
MSDIFAISIGQYRTSKPRALSRFSFNREPRGIRRVSPLPGERQSRNNRAVLKAILLIIIILLGVASIRFTPLRHYISSVELHNQLDRFGMWAPFAFIVFYAFAICLFIPGTVLTGIGAAIFGPYLGFLYVWAGAMIGSVMAFAISRTLGREFVASLLGERLRKYDDGVERKGFATVLYLRLIYSPFTITNIGMGLTKVRFSDYFLGTALGIIIGTFIISFLFGTFIEIWASRDWERLASFRFVFAIFCFVLSFFIPKAIRKINGE